MRGYYSWRSFHTFNGQNKHFWTGRISDYCSIVKMSKLGVGKTYNKRQKRFFEIALAHQKDQFANLVLIQPVRCGKVAVVVRILDAEATSIPAQRQLPRKCSCVSEIVLYDSLVASVCCILPAGVY